MEQIGNARPDLRSAIAALQALMPGAVYTDVDLSALSRWRVGGIADCIVAPRTLDEIRTLMRFVGDAEIPYVVIGSSSNLMFADEGLRVLGIHFGAEFSQLRIEGNTVWSQAGVWVPEFARQVARAGLTGAEHVCGIPGTLGGLIYMNGGSQRKGIGDNIAEVTTITPSGDIQRYDQTSCSFAYRASRFQASNDIILEARFQFDHSGEADAIRRSMLSILRQRREKFPRKLPNCGSVFVSNPAMYDEYGPPGAVIEQCGLKGVVHGGAQISPLHANFIVNNGRATASDLLYLIHKVRDTVRARTGYDMPAEVRYLTPEGELTPAHLKAEQLFRQPAPVTAPANRFDAASSR
ncbi:UDP-N-acetylmuramate dehydrogenase [Marinobacter fonticola]|uniref:UDP-N-acetylmuramate dehydrogenase n=1 Tax=Marinobacter fonticola TaxID=2603215 RepID=UPI0011E86D09|nr:UDP-N-acetylmuramate dehydrogenase [Marinobacter fonticola]